MEKTKVKVVFRLQFHATHIPQTGWDKLFVSFISADSGKVTAKTSKSQVRNGTCKWADPIYETTRLLQDTNTKQYDEKLYKLVVATGTSRSSLLGEANINLADYAEAPKPTSVALPLLGCDSGTVLHVAVQLLTSKTGFREFEQQSELREGGLQTTNHRIRNEPAVKPLASRMSVHDKMEKVNIKVRFQSDSSRILSLGEVELTEDYTDSAVGIDDSSNTSESLYAEKHDSSTHENESLKSTTSGDLGVIPLNNSHPEKGDASDHRLSTQGPNDWVHGWSSDYSMDNELVTAYEENSRLKRSLDMAESSLSELKLEMSSLQRQADELGVETHNCCQCFSKEMESGEELAREVSELKSECSKLKTDIHQLKHSLLYPHISDEDISRNWVLLFQDLQMKWLHGLFAMEDKLSEAQNKALHRGLEVDFSFVHLDLEALQQVLRDLKQGIAEGVSLLNTKLRERGDAIDCGAMSTREPEQFVGKVDFVDACQYHLEGNCISKPFQMAQESYPLDATIVLRDRVSELQRELEESKTEQDSLTRKLDQMESYYEAFIQELEENQKRTLEELHDLRDEHSTCMFTITSCNTQVEKMHENMNEQLLKFSEERHKLESVNKELEMRVIKSEAALKRARRNSSLAVDHLQKDLELLSFQVLSMFKTNENLIREAFAETSQSSFQEYPEDGSDAFGMSLQKDCASVRLQYERLQGSQAVVGVSEQSEHEPGLDVANSLAGVIDCKKNVEVCDEVVQRDSDVLDSEGNFLESVSTELQQCQKQNEELKKQLFSMKVLLEDSNRSLQLQEELYRKAETELGEMHLQNINLDVFSVVLQEAMFEARKDIDIMKEDMKALAQKIVHTTESEELLMLRLQTALDDVNTLSVYNNNWSAKYNELTLQNQILEEKFHSVSNENGGLIQKITDCESMILEYKSYKSKYEDCSVEKTELMNLLKNETLIKCSLQDEAISMHEELKTLKKIADEQSSANSNLEKTLSFLRDKLEDLRSTMITYDDDISGRFTHGCALHDMEGKDLMSIVSQLEELLKEACEKVCQLEVEKKDMMDQRDTARGLLTDTESEISLIKRKYELDSRGMVNKLGEYTDLVDKLQLELEYVARKLKISLESEERYAEQIDALISNLSLFEVELQHVSNENKDLAQKILALECINQELERTKLAVIDSAQENQALISSLRSGNEQSVHLSNELSILMEKMKSMSDDLKSERSSKAVLEGTLADLTSELDMKKDLLISFEKEKGEVLHLKQLVSDLEIEKSGAYDLILQCEKRLGKADEVASFFRMQVTDLETHLTASHEYLLAADVELICTRNQFQTRMQELVQQLESLDGCYRELHLKHLDLLTKMNGRISSEEQNNDVCAELEEYKTKEAIIERDVHRHHEQEHEIAQLKHMLLQSEEMIDDLKSSRDELDITTTVLRAKLEEQCVLIPSLQECGNEVVILQKQKRELSQRLSEQILKTEEFKNLSIHLKELKDKAEAEGLEARGKRETEVPAASLQESLRMAFIREQCETKVQELRNQLFASKKHGEEMLLKLQDALNEVEDRRKGEASYVKRNEELLTKILELESELQTSVAENREKVKAFDKMKAELECSLISLDCSREEKGKLEASLQKCIEERTNIAIELGSLKERLKISAPPSSILKGGNFKPSAEDAGQIPLQEGLTSETENGLSKSEVTQQGDTRQLALVNEQFQAQSLKSSMEHLHEELKRMKNENSLSYPVDVRQLEPVFHGLQRHLLQLEKANEQLGSIFPLFNEFPGSGNALEKVLALEIELAEALQAKKNSNFTFQSSFLKQHTDEEAVFRSFRDINELIKDMLELKGGYLAVETELKEMHDRYSQLSIQFAEVEGERQKLVMKLKNARSPKKASHLYRSTSTISDYQP